VLAYDIQGLSLSPAVKGTDFLVLDNSGFGMESAASNAFKSALITRLDSLRSSGLKIAYVDLSRLYTAVTGPTPGYKAFGYTSAGACLKSNTTTVGACADPAHTFQWIPG
jgi:hypothetical protein